MKRQNKKLSLSLVLIPALLWAGLASSRSFFYRTPCAHNPTLCSKESVFPIDRLSITFDSGTADDYSYFTQNLSGVFAFTVPHLWTGIRLATGALSPLSALSTIATDTLIVSQAVAWNGMFTELSHLISQRPRPFVYSDPQAKGVNPSHYTSFYSGHTSFAAATGMALCLLLIFRRAPKSWLIFWAANGAVLTFGTAYLRIIAGRHFFTDVVVGALAGSLVAWLVARQTAPFQASELPSKN